MNDSPHSRTLRPEECPITGESESRRVFVYDHRPEGEMAYPVKDTGEYHREIWQFLPSGHYVSCHLMEIEHDYSGNYLTHTYGDYEGLHRRFIALRDLPTEMSDNYGRLKTIKDFAGTWFSRSDVPTLLDIGSGTGIFPHSIMELGWNCLALDLDPRAVDHLNNELGIRAICTDFHTELNLGLFNIICFNKVLEHVIDPLSLLRTAIQYLQVDSFIYLEVPDGEIAELHGPEREEFFVEHHHVFSFRSLIALIQSAGLQVISMERLVEPSTKCTIRAFCSIPPKTKG